MKSTLIGRFDFTFGALMTLHPTADERTLTDLEFEEIRSLLAERCRTETATERALCLEPESNRNTLEAELGRTREMLEALVAGMPHFDFEEVTREAEMLRIPASVLTEESFLKIRSANLLLNEWLDYLAEIPSRFPLLEALSTRTERTDELILAINQVLDDKGKVRDDASGELARIREEIKSVRRDINRNFDREAKRLRERGILSDTRESFVNERRVLAVLSEYKRQVEGTVLGSSKTGNVTYIEPRINQTLNNELEMLFDDERKEIFRILRQLSALVRKHLPLIEAMNALLIELDFLRAKARLARDTDSDMPGMAEECEIALKDARHPLLFLQNQSLGRTTVPQALKMDKFSRMLVISGPNAGGKSITLKMVGLIQVMFQSGLLVPVSSDSRLGIFTLLRSDIGDNQSIENQLSTYSYRLRRMKHFLEVGNRKTLFLLDEFGTGSDPDLGGALAEAFFEALYNKKSFGVITTHYGNIKRKASQLRNAVNGCMLFDSEHLTPLYRLSLGQPGSSFTFEVARINGIPDEIIQKAIDGTDTAKVETDRLLSELQREKARTEALNKKAMDATRDAEKTKSGFDEKQRRLEEKLRAQGELMERQQKFLARGKKMAEFIAGWKARGKNDSLREEIMKYVQSERTREEANKRKETKRKDKIRNEEEELREAELRARLVPGARVRLKNTKQVGTLLETDGKEAVVAFGVFKTKTELQRLVPVA
jgi:DNA mismatch repair protein MutS2